MPKKDLHELPKFQDRWSHLYLEHGRIDVEASSILFYDKDGQIKVPVDQLAFLMLGPGTRVSHAAMKTLAENNCLVCWTGEQGVRLYAASTGGTHSAHRLLRQARLWADDSERMKVVLRMYQKRFSERLDPSWPIEKVRALEGQRVRREYEMIAKAYGVEWKGRNYDQGQWNAADPLNRALSAANACLYGICHAAILSAGYSPAIGFVHTGKMLSFVYDVADLYKTQVAVPSAFSVVKAGPEEVERRARIECRNVFHETKLMDRILPDIAEVLDAGDDAGEVPGEFEGRAVTLADRTAERRLLGEPERAGQGQALGKGGGEEQGWIGPPDVERQVPAGLRLEGTRDEHEGDGGDGGDLPGEIQGQEEG
jgi:CRISPR-associated protein Cas1